MASFIQKLIQQRKKDIQTKSSRALAESMKGAQDKEKAWRSLSSLFKTGFKFIDLTKGLLSAGLDAFIDPIGRHFGAGAIGEDITVADEHLRFGGKRALEESRTGLETAISDYQKGSIADALLGFGASKVGGALLDKVPKGKFDIANLFGGKSNLPAGEYADKLGKEFKSRYKLKGLKQLGATTATTNNILVSGSGDNIRWEVSNVNNNKG